MKLEDKHLVYMDDDMYIPIHYKEMAVKQPFFKGKGNHSISELETLCEQFTEYVHQQQVIKQNCMKHIVELKFNVDLSEDVKTKQNKDDMEDMKGKVFDFLKSNYVDSEVVGGEFIHFEVIPKSIGGNVLTEKDVVEGVQDFLDWDGSEETFRVFEMDYGWVIKYLEHDWTKYDFKKYPTRTFLVTIDEHNDNWEHSYKIAPESLYTILEDNLHEDVEDYEAEDVDDSIYYYVEDEYFFDDAETICKEHLDLPMTLIKEEL